MVAKLVQAAELGGPEPTYTALSYCWGDTRPFRLLQGNHEALMMDIPWAELPLTVRDAMSYTKALHIGYIWIDSLCIVQDDVKDWAFEAERMLRIYAGSHLTFLAREATNADGGCFSLPADLSPQSHVFLASTGTNGIEAVYAHVSTQPIKQRGPLRSRGWTLQETVLSRRTVEIKHSELVWNCHSEVFHETGLKLGPEMILRTTEQLTPVLGDMVGINAQADIKWNHIWWKHIEDYTRRRFTYSSDRIPALAGLAELYQRVTKDEPFLGLWKNTLHEDLSWMRSDSKRDRELDPPPPTPLPSWSPFSCRQSVEFRPWHSRRWGRDSTKAMYGPVESCLTIMLCHTSWTGRRFVSNPGFSLLIVSGPVSMLHLTQAIEAGDRYTPSFNINVEVGLSRGRRRPLKCRIQWDEEGFRPAATWLCLLIERKIPERHEVSAETFLVLDRVITASNSSVYRRIGLGSLGRGRDEDEAESFEWTFDLTNLLTLTLA
ncbi:hypothetical protein LTR86_007615 [Recurvomyces mirabilis]|nr:hypothetical protein LTR86_007615 [Recurvomyces mirabilis]